MSLSDVVKMAASGFGDDLFAEFERDPEPSDKILRQKIQNEEQNVLTAVVSEDTDSESEEDSDGRNSGYLSDDENETGQSALEQSVSNVLSIIRHETDRLKENGGQDIAHAQKSLEDEYRHIVQQSILITATSVLILGFEIFLAAAYDTC